MKPVRTLTLCLIAAFALAAITAGTAAASTPPTAVTKAASHVKQTTATLNGTVNPNGFEVTECKFEYGRTSAYGSSVPCETAPGSGTTPVEVSAAVTGLTQNALYHVRVSATSSEGTGQGADVAFATALKLPEWGKCEPTEGGTGGRFGNAGCTAIVKPLHKTEYQGGFEWYSLPENAEAYLFYAYAEEGIEQPAQTTTLTLSGGHRITCGPLDFETEIPLTGADVTRIAPFLAFRGCVDDEGEVCRTTDASGAGEIDTQSAHEHGIFEEPGSWTGTTRFIEGKNTSDPKVGIVYKTETQKQEFLAQIVCEGEIHAIGVGGDKNNEALTFGITPVNTMSHEYTATLSQSGGVQLPATVEGRKLVAPKAQLGSGEWQSIGIEASMLFPITGGQGSGPRRAGVSGLELKATP